MTENVYSPHIADYAFLSGSAISGILIDRYGKQVLNGFSATPGTSAPKTIAQMMNLEQLPKAAVGAMLNFAGTTYYSTAAASPDNTARMAHFLANYATMYPVQTATSNVAFGWVKV